MAGSLGQETRQLGKNSLTYLVPNLLARGISFLLAPVYTRAMTAEDYGIIGVATTITALLTTALSLSLHGSVSRYYFHLETDRERSSFLSTVVAFEVIAPLGVVLALYGLGAAGFLDVFASVRFEPHLKYVLVTAWLGIFPSIYINAWMAREEPGRIAIFNGVTVGATVASMLVFVVLLHQGAIGQLRAALTAAIVVTCFVLVSLRPLLSFTVSRIHLRTALAYGIPLTPHLMANWALSASDRLVLERFVPRNVVGQYSLGYTFGMVGAVIAGAIGMAFFPIVTRKLTEKDPEGVVPRLGTYAVLPSALVAALVAAVSPDAIRLLTPESYHSAGDYVPLVSLGVFFQALYGVWSQGTYFSRQTHLVPLVTGAGALLNLGLNLWLVPRYGAIAAAATTAIAYFALAAMHGALAQKLFPIRWEYGRWALLIFAGFLSWSAAAAIHLASPLVGLFVRAAICTAAFGLALWLSRFFRAGELAGLRALVARRAG